MDLITDFDRFRPSLLAALLLFCRRLLKARGASLPATNAEAIALVGAKKSQAYAMVDAIEEALLEIDAPKRIEAAPPEDGAHVETVEAVRDFVMAHPGCVAAHGARTIYSDVFRVFVLELRRPDGPAHQMSVDKLARAAGVPLGTLKDWLRAPPVADESDQAACDQASSATDTAVATILARWPAWSGTFGEFCRHLRAHHRIEAGQTFVSHVLEAGGLRVPRRQKPDKLWSRHSFKELFPNAQWIGDGSQFFVEIDGQRFVFNLEAIVDASSNAVLAVEVTDVENEAAVLDAVDAAEHTAGTKPLALSLDNKPSNHTERIEEHIEPALALASTPFSPTAKACVEGFFGLFEQNMPPICVETIDKRELARRILEIQATAFARGRNGRPRKKLGDKSPAQAHADHVPTDEEIEEARALIDELGRRREKMQNMRERRQDEVSIQLIKDALMRHGLDEPDDHFARTLSGYTREAVSRGIAIFDGKAAVRTIPDGADRVRYLGGIIRNEHHRLELLAIADALLSTRLRQRDLSLAELADELERLMAVDDDPAGCIIRLVDRALESDPEIDFRFFARAAHSRLAELELSAAKRLFEHLSRRIAARFHAHPRRRQRLLGDLSEALLVAG